VVLSHEIGFDSHSNATVEDGGVTIGVRTPPDHHSGQVLVASVRFIEAGIQVLINSEQFASPEDQHPLRNHLAHDRRTNLTVAYDPVGKNHPHERILPVQSGDISRRALISVRGVRSCPVPDPRTPDVVS
jgi:hypothetical protein